MPFSIKKGGKEVRFAVFDPNQFMNKSLDAVCKDFGLADDEAKGIFPHKFITTMEQMENFHYSDGASYPSFNEKCYITLEQLNDPKYYFDRDLIHRIKVKEEWTEDMVAPFRDGHGIDIRLLCHYYLRKDCQALRAFCSVFFKAIAQEKGRYNPYRYMTLSQLSYTMWLNDFVDKSTRSLLVIPSEECYMSIKDATYGGRVFVGRREWKTTNPAFREYNVRRWVEGVLKLQTSDKKWDTLTEKERQALLHPDHLNFTHCLLYNNLKPHEYLVELDFFSLYPSVMYNYPYPVGQAEVRNDLRHSRLEMAFQGDGRLPLGIFYIDYVPSENLFMAALPSRDEHGSLIWELRPGSGWYTSIDIENAWAAGYDIKLHKGFVWPEGRRIFTDYVDECMKNKIKGDRTGNASLRNYGKLMSNSLYGKLLQSIMPHQTEIVNSKEKMEAFFEKYIWEDVKFLGEHVVLHGLDPKPKLTRPYQLGAFVLAYSRRENWRHFAQFDSSYIQRASPCFPGINPMLPTVSNLHRTVLNSPVYGDTDSMYVRGDQLCSSLNLKNALGHLKNEDEVDFTKNKQKGKPGGVRILWFIALTVKTYAYVYIKSDNTLHVKIASKGIKTSLLYFNDFLKGADTFGKMKPGREVDMGGMLKGLMSKGVEADKFSKVFATQLSRTFNKNEQAARWTVNDALEYDPSGVLTLPIGHVCSKEWEREENIPKGKIVLNKLQETVLKINAEREARQDLERQEEIQVEQDLNQYMPVDPYSSE
jgi:hypothetical protein